MLSSFAVTQHGIAAGFSQALRPRATLADLKQAVHIAASADTVAERIAQHDRLRQQPLTAGAQQVDVNLDAMSDMPSTLDTTSHSCQATAVQQSEQVGRSCFNCCVHGLTLRMTIPSETANHMFLLAGKQKVLFDFKCLS